MKLPRLSFPNNNRRATLPRKFPILPNLGPPAGAVFLRAVVVVVVWGGRPVCVVGFVMFKTVPFNGFCRAQRDGEIIGVAITASGV